MVALLLPGELHPAAAPETAAASPPSLTLPLTRPRHQMLWISPPWAALFLSFAHRVRLAIPPSTGSSVRTGRRTYGTTAESFWPRMLCRDARLHQAHFLPVGQEFYFLNIIVYCEYYQVRSHCKTCEKVQKNEIGHAFAHGHTPARGCRARAPPDTPWEGSRLAVPADLHVPLQPVLAAALPLNLWPWGWDAIPLVWAVLASAPVAAASALVATAEAARAMRLRRSRRSPVAGAVAATSWREARRR